MPLTWTCKEHGVIGEHTDDVHAHAREEHPGVMVIDLRDRGVIESSFTTQVEAQGNKAKHIIRCRGCGIMVEIEPGADTRCPDCLTGAG